MSRIIFIDAHRVEQLLDYPDLVAGLKDLHQADMDVMEDLLLEQPGATGTATHFFFRAAWQRHQAMGVKLVTIFPDNPGATGLPAIQGIYVLFDGSDGSLKAVIDGTALTWRKTAADSALGASYLAREDVEHLLMVGAGAMAAPLIAAHRAVRPSIGQVSIWNRDSARATKLADALSVSGVKAVATTDLEAAARQANIICCATRVTTPLIKGEWLQPGCHLDLVGAFTKTMREADDEAMRRGNIYVDSRKTTVGEIGEILLPMEAGVITEHDILGDLYDLCRNTVAGRRTRDEITIFKNGGGGHLDLMTAEILVSRIENDA